jgi:ABC-2 type transport system permease protein
MSLRGIGVVARQEFRLRIRAGRWRWLLAAWVLVLVGFTVLLRAAAGTADALQDKGTVVFGGLMLFVLGLALLVVPSLAAQSVNGDRERGTLATLQVTLLSPAEITLGKFAAAWGTSLVFLALTLPMVLYAVTQGGVTLSRVVVVLAVIAVLLGTVCAVSLWLSAVLTRTTTSAVLAYLGVFGVTIGTLVVFGLGTALTAEDYTENVPVSSACQNRGDADTQLECSDEQPYTSTRARTDRTWWLLAPNPFVILADAAPQLPPLREGSLSDEELFRQEEARSLDPLGQIGTSVSGLRVAPRDQPDDAAFFTSSDQFVDLTPDGPPVWPTGLAVDVAVAALALVLTGRRLRTPSRTLPRGQRVA